MRQRAITDDDGDGQTGTPLRERGRYAAGADRHFAVAGEMGNSFDAGM